MGRWDVFNRDNGRDTAAGLPREHRREESLRALPPNARQELVVVG